MIDYDIRASHFPYYSSEEQIKTTTVADVTYQQTFAFDDAEEQFVATIRGDTDPTHDWGGSSDVDLANWLERPILAATHVWEVDEPFPQIYFNPWAHFLDSPSVAQKISNFYLLRCKMNMKVVVNGSQMHYGRGFISYRPLMTVPGERFQYDPNAPAGSNPFDDVGRLEGVGYALEDSEEASITIQSQWPKIFIDPGQSMGGEMNFPFFFGANWFRIPYKDWVAKPSAIFPIPTQDVLPSAVGGATPSKAYGPYGCHQTHMGVVHSTSLQPLRHANGADDPVTIQVFLWASDVKLSVPTSYSHPGASSLLSAASSSSFKPKMRTEYVPNFLGDLAKPNDISTRLELGDSSLNTDPATAGVDDDDTDSVISIAKRECFLDKFTWPVGSPAETLMWQAKVTPQYYRPLWADSVERVGAPVLIPLPMTYAALPFGYWRGTIKYRIQIIASNLHRGRIRLVYDPLKDLLGNPDVNLYPEDLMNLQYSRVIDIASEEGRDFTFEVGFMQSTPYLPLDPVQSIYWASNPTVRTKGNYGAVEPFGPGAFTFPPTMSGNGSLSIYILNRLAVPSTQVGLNNDVTVVVYASAGDNLSFQMPTSTNLDSISYTGPTGIPVNYKNKVIPSDVGNLAARRKANDDDGIVAPPVLTRSHTVRPTSSFTPKMDSAAMGTTQDENVPTDPPLITDFGNTSEMAAPMAAVTFGEDFCSWRKLMARWVLYSKETYCDTDKLPPGRNSEFASDLIILPDFPPFPGPSPLPFTWRQMFCFPAGDPNQFLPYAPSDVDGAPFSNQGIEFAPPAKYLLNTPGFPDLGVDTSTSLRVNPGRLTMLHFVTRMFIARKGAIKNKYVMCSNNGDNAAGGTPLMSVKRLSDSGVLDGKGYFGFRLFPQDGIDSNEVIAQYPASGGLWDQAHCRIGINSPHDPQGLGIQEIRRCQNLNGFTQTGCDSIAAPNWFNRKVYPADQTPAAYAVPVPGELAGDYDLQNLFDGAHVTTLRQQPVIETEIPFYMNTRFILNDVVANNTSSVSAHCLKFDSVTAPGLHMQNEVVERFVAPGADFALFYLANVPPLHLNARFPYTTVGLDPDGVQTLVNADYGTLKYRLANRQEVAAFNDLIPPPGGNNSTIASRNYFWSLLSEDYAPNLAYMGEGT